MKRIVAVISLVCIGVSTYAQEDTPKNDVLTFEEAIKLGIEKNVALHTQKNQLYGAQARKAQAYANFLPDLSGQAYVQRSDGLQIDPLTGSAANVSADAAGANINTNLILFNGFGRINTLQQNNRLFSAQNAQVKRSKQDVVFTVASQYLQVLLDQELLRIAAENLKVQNVTLEQIKGFVQVGSRPAADEYTQNALVQNANLVFLRAKIALENDRALLAQTLQLDPAVSFSVSQPQWGSDTEYFKSLSIDSLNNIALANREDLKQQNLLVEANEYGLRAASSGYMPTLSLFASYGSQYYASNAWEILNRPELKQPSFSEQFNRLNPTLSYGVSLRVPIFDRLATRTNRVTSRVQHDNAKLTRDNLLMSIKIDVQRAFNNYQTAIESYNASLIQYEAGELALRTQQESYDLGVSAQVVLATANQAFVQAAASRAQAQVTLVFQQILLEYALGTLKVESIYGE